MGSPPQVRGKQDGTGIFILRGRITPAGAGKTVVGLSYMQRHQDHPRRCGENCRCAMGTRIIGGSPPQVRGKRFRVRLMLRLPRITPAGAGKTTILATLRTLLQDHPRRCGENRFVYRFVVHSSGSPPQVRGKLPATKLCTKKVRITPAGAGKTLLAKFQSFTLWDHPRRCGENVNRVLIDFKNIGSPPQVRGKR